MSLRGRAQQPDPPPPVYASHAIPSSVEWRTGVTAKRALLLRQHAVRPGQRRSVCAEHLVERLTILEPAGMEPCPMCLRRVLAWGLAGPGGRTAPPSDAPQVGEDHHRAKLTVQDVREIRAARAAGETLRSLAGRYGVSSSSVHRLCRGESWRSVE